MTKFITYEPDPPKKFLVYLDETNIDAVASELAYRWHIKTCVTYTTEVEGWGSQRQYRLTWDHPDATKYEVGAGFVLIYDRESGLRVYSANKGELIGWRKVDQ